MTPEQLRLFEGIMYKLRRQIEAMNYRKKNGYWDRIDDASLMELEVDINILEVSLWILVESNDTSLRLALKNCETCNKSFANRTKKGRFCSSGCRVIAHRSKIR
jgi:protein-arginine kinase activator protein McsA